MEKSFIGEKLRTNKDSKIFLGLESLNKHSDEEVLIKKTVKATIQTLYDETTSDKFDNAVEALKNYLAYWID